MKKVIIATKNKGKAREFAQLLEPMGYQVLTLLDFPDEIDIEETGTTFAENALLKAETLSKKMNIAVMADDSGLMVDALDGRPGVYSARYAGEHGNDVANNQKILTELAHVPTEKRTARFFCAIAFVVPNQSPIICEGSCEGRILFEPMGDGGFGYDPIFYVNEIGKSMAECTMIEKNQISHRARALAGLVDQLQAV